jgi:hypothetical protein
MKQPSELTRKQLEEALIAVQVAVYGDIAPSGIVILNPAVEWTQDNIENVAAALNHFGLAPDRVIKLGPTDIHQNILDFIFAEWDEDRMGKLPDSRAKAIEIFEQYYTEQGLTLPWKESHVED